MSLMKAFPEILEAGRSEYETIQAGQYHTAEETGDREAAWQNRLVLGENGAFLKALLQNEKMAGKLQMVYIDPPFFSKATYDAVIHLEGMGKKGEDLSLKVPAYTDVWDQGMQQYLTMLSARLYLIRDLLSEEGTIWVHLDWHASHYVRILLDEIFGEKRFVNEIIWTYKSGGSGKKHFSRKHDTILVYSKTPHYYFRPLQEKSYNRGLKPYHFKGVEEFQDETGWYTMVNMKDVWQIDMVGRTSAERTGYATQKPEALLERILSCSTREGDLCADFFCGSGTLAAVAQRMNRRWICCDSGKLAAEGTLKRAASKEKDEEKVHTGICYQSCVPEGFLDVSCSREENTLMLELKGYSQPQRFSAEDDWRTADGSISAGELRQKAPLRLLDSWSVDRSYDGDVHRPDIRILRDKKGQMRTSLTFRLPAAAENGTGADRHAVSIAAVDVFGNRYRRILEL